MKVNSVAGREREFEKVVVHLRDGVIKGFVAIPDGDSLDTLLQKATAACPATFQVRLLDEETVREVAVEDIKAIFYVKGFDGDSQHKNLQFYRGAPIVHGVWIRVDFIDGEVMEGLVHNTVRFLVDPAFFMRPTDPYSNNRLVYVVKKWLKEFRVLGLRNI